MSEQEPPIAFDKFVAKKRRLPQGQPRVWILYHNPDHNPADKLRGRFITGSPSLLRALYAPRTSASPRRRNTLSSSDDDSEPIA